MALGAVPDVRMNLAVRAVALALIRVHHVAARELGAVGVAAVVLDQRRHLVLHGSPARAVLRHGFSPIQDLVVVAEDGTILARGLVADLRRAVHAAGALRAVLRAGVAAALV